MKLGFNSEYKYIIISPTDIYRDMFNLNREIIVVFSAYDSIEARTLDVFEYVAKKHSSLRIEKICNVLISGDVNVETSLSEMIKNEPESQIIIPFYYEELKNSPESFFFRNRFKKYFYSRDLFACEAPLEKDLYFFGRSDLIQELINRLKSGENSGLFGLRKTGKTSLINGIVRNLKKEEILAIIIDCQDTSFNQRRWFEALYYMCLRAKKTFDVDVDLPEESLFTEKDASILTEQFLKKCREINSVPAYFIFDEIENISRNTAPAKHWGSELDFLLFWQTLRSIFQRNRELIAYLIVGTNPTCIEKSKIGDIDNPIFNHFTPLYIPGFGVTETREMVRKLGRRMGLKFEESIYSNLTEDFGGHPFLIRQVCSLISKKVSGQDRPVSIGRISYGKGKGEFELNNSNYLEMIVSILKDYYPDEYEMLSFLANDDVETFNEFAELHPTYTAHLIGYGLIKKEHSGYDYNIDAVREYILKQSKFRKINLSEEDMWAEISYRRNSAEVRLRRLIKMLLRGAMGATSAQQEVLNIFGSPRKERLQNTPYSDLFDASVSEIYFSDLSKIISNNWNVFKNTFEKTKKETFGQLEFINQSRADAHAKKIGEDNFAYFRVCMGKIEQDLDEAL